RDRRAPAQPDRGLPAWQEHRLDERRPPRPGMPLHGGRRRLAHGHRAAAGGCTPFDVVVTMDIGALQSVLTQLLPHERNIRVSAAFDSVVLSGGVTDSGALARAVELAQAYVGNGR